MAPKTNIGKTVYFSPALPDTNDAAGFEALTWTKVEHPIQAPQFKVSHSNTDVPNLETGFTEGVKGAASGADTETSYAIHDDTLTTGQTALKTAADDDDGFGSFKVVRGSGVNKAPVAGDPVQYALGYVHSYSEEQPTNSSYAGFSVNFKQNAPTVTATEPA